MSFDVFVQRFVDGELLAHLPEELTGDTRVVTSGAELLHAITTA